jgi:hypothetical protein
VDPDPTQIQDTPLQAETIHRVLGDEADKAQVSAELLPWRVPGQFGEGILDAIGIKSRALNHLLGLMSEPGHDLAREG